LHGEKTKVSEEKLLSVRLLGPPEASFEGRNLRFGRKKALALLCCLAAKEGNRSRGELAGLCGQKATSGAPVLICAAPWPGSGRQWGRTGTVSP
jgi:hypothetical protein